jgi:chemotaxis-related protein WspD
MSYSLRLASSVNPCWQQIGVWGDRTCPELPKVTHCHNCPVFAAAGRRFLDVPSPSDYLDEWTTRLGTSDDANGGEELSLLVFRLGEEWLALSVNVLVEVTPYRTPHRIPHRGGFLEGLINIRGELHLCFRLDLLLGIERNVDKAKDRSRLVIINHDADRWAFVTDDVDQVHRLTAQTLTTAAPTLSRAATKINKGVFNLRGHSAGLIDEVKLFQAIREHAL